MKPLFNVVAGLLFMLPVTVFAQGAGLDAALNKGSAADVGVFFSGRIDVSIPGTESSLSSSEAVQVLNSFFTQNVVKGYNRAHLTAPQNERSAYSLGDLYTSNGTYRVYLYFDDQKKISEIRIQK